MMQPKSNNKPLYIALSIGLILFVLIVVFTPRQIDWSLSFSKSDKIPFGNSILYEQLPTLFAPNDTRDSYTSLIQFINDSTLTNTNYIVINNEYQPDTFEVELLLNLVEQGNQVFIAANSFSKQFKERLKLDVNYLSLRDISNLTNTEMLRLNFANRRLKALNDYEYERLMSNHYFTQYDTLNTTVLGYANKGQTNFIQTRHGKGSLFINTIPLAFTNHSMLKNDNHEYIFKCLSYLPIQPTIWDEFYKPNQAIGRSKLEFVLKNPSLKYAYYLLLIGTIIFIVFESKRKQRMMPIVMPPINSSLGFIETIGRLYYNRRNHLDLAKKKYLIFFDFIRTRYHINLNDIASGLLVDGQKELADKSGIKVRIIDEIMTMGNRLSMMNKMSEDELIRFNEKIEFFYNQCK